MNIHGNVICIDKKDLCYTWANTGQTGNAVCIDSSDLFQSAGFVIDRTLSLVDSTTFKQNQFVDSTNGLTLSFIAPKFIDLSFVGPDGTTYDGYYTEPKPYNPLWTNYGLFKSDNSIWVLQGYRFRPPMNPKVGLFYINMVAPADIGTYKIQWLFKKDSSSYVTAVDQPFNVDTWASGPLPPWPGPDYAVMEVFPAYYSKFVGESAVFTLIKHETPPNPVSYRWRKAGVYLTDGTAFSGTQTDTLVITNISMSEYHFYDCIVSDTLTSSKGWLFVNL